LDVQFSVELVDALVDARYVDARGQQSVASAAERWRNAPARSAIAVVITDMLMPVLDGPTTIRALRKLNPNVRVIGMSGYTRQRMSGPAPDLMLQKPFRASDLLSAIHSMLTPPLADACGVPNPARP
jgi:CheY-like chemotaxis protein